LSNSKKQTKTAAKPKSRVTKKQNRVGFIAIVAIAVASVILLTGQLHINPPMSNSTTLSIVQVSIENGAGVNPNSPGYSPSNITVVIGINNTVKWVNYDSMPHTVTAVNGSFDSGNLDPGQSFVHTFNTPGTYVYVCIYHHWMEGTVIVIASTNG